MAERNKLRTLFCGLNARDASDGQYIAFLMCALLQQGESLRLHRYGSCSDSHAFGNGLVSNIHHMGSALIIEMGESAH